MSQKPTDLFTLDSKDDWGSGLTAGTWVRKASTRIGMVVDVSPTHATVWFGGTSGGPLIPKLQRCRAHTLTPVSPSLTFTALQPECSVTVEPDSYWVTIDGEMIGLLLHHIPVERLTRWGQVIWRGKQAVDGKMKLNILLEVPNVVVPAARSRPSRRRRQHIRR